MVGDVRGFLQRSPILKVDRNPCGTERVIAHGGTNAGRDSAALDHGVGVGLGQRLAGHFRRALVEGLEQRRTRSVPQACAVEIIIQVGLKGMVARQFDLLATLCRRFSCRAAPDRY